MVNGSTELELPNDQMRDMVRRAMDRVVEHIASLPDQPSTYWEDGRELAQRLAESLPDRGAEFEELLDLVFETAVPPSYNTAGPGYLAYIPGGGLFHSAVADLIANAVNRYVGVWVAAPGLVQLESNVVRWFAEIVGYPRSAGGMLTTGGSLANFTAVVTARRMRLPENFLSGMIYTSDQTHHSVTKAAVLAGFPPRNVREIPTDEEFRIRLDVLADTIASDRAAGRQPFLVVGSAGTTNTGAIDDLPGIADLAEAERLWFHVDAAYGGFFMLTERGRSVMGGLGRADSITLDPHKGLFLPYGNGSLLVRRPEDLYRAHCQFADYMPPMQDDADRMDFCQLSPELSRDCRGLRAWLPIKMHGIGAFRAALDEKLDLTAWAAEALRTIPYLHIVAPPRLTVVAFRLEPPGIRGHDLDRINKQLLERINAAGNVYLTPTTLNGRFTLRICILSFRTHRDRIEQCVEDVRLAATAITAD